MSGGTARVLLPRLRTRARRASWRRPRTHSGVIVKDRRRDDLLRTLKGRAHTAVQVTLRGRFTAAVEKIRRLSEKLASRGITNVDIEVDGGINANTAPDVVAAGARVLVAGSAVFGKPDYRAAIEAIRQAGAKAIAS